MCERQVSKGKGKHEGLMKVVFVFCCFGFRTVSEPKELVGQITGIRV